MTTATAEDLEGVLRSKWQSGHKKYGLSENWLGAELKYLGELNHDQMIVAGLDNVGRRGFVALKRPDNTLCFLEVKAFLDIVDLVPNRRFKQLQTECWVLNVLSDHTKDVSRDQLTEAAARLANDIGHHLTFVWITSKTRRLLEDLEEALNAGLVDLPEFIKATWGEESYVAIPEREARCAAVEFVQ